MSAPSAFFRALSLTGGRKRARDTYDGKSLRGVDVVLDFGAVVAGTQSYADETVVATLIERGASRLVVCNADHEGAEYLVHWLIESAEIHGVSDRLVVPESALRPALALVV